MIINMDMEPDSEKDIVKNEISKLKKELCQMTTNKKHGAFIVNGSIKPRVRDIGKRLDEIGGFSLMSDVGLTVDKHLQRELDFAWSSIGDWMC